MKIIKSNRYTAIKKRSNSFLSTEILYDIIFWIRNGMNYGSAVEQVLGKQIKNKEEMERIKEEVRNKLGLKKIRK